MQFNEFIEFRPAQCAMCGRVLKSSETDEDESLCPVCALAERLQYHPQIRLQARHLPDEGTATFNPAKLTVQGDPSVLYLGAEIEITDPSNNLSFEHGIAKAYDILGPGRFYAQYDSSIGNGFELTSHPMSLGYWKKIKPLVKETFDVLLNEGWRAHDTARCGLHVHFSKRPALGHFLNLNVNSEVGKRIYSWLIARWAEEIAILSRRGFNAFAGYCYLRPYNENFRSFLEDCNTGGYLSTYIRGHHSAVNLQEDNTIEFRFFRGSLNLESFYAAIEFPDAVVEWIKTFSSKEDLFSVEHTTFAKFREFFTSKERYAELTSYIARVKLDEKSAALHNVVPPEETDEARFERLTTKIQERIVAQRELRDRGVKRGQDYRPCFVPETIRTWGDLFGKVILYDDKLAWIVGFRNPDRIVDKDTPLNTPLPDKIRTLNFIVSKSPYEDLSNACFYRRAWTHNVHPRLYNVDFNIRAEDTRSTLWRLCKDQSGAISPEEYREFERLRTRINEVPNDEMLCISNACLSVDEDNGF